MLHKTGIHLFSLRNMLRSCSKLKETSYIRIFHESPKLRRIWFVWRVFLENWKQAHAIDAKKIMQWTLMLYSGEQRSVYLWGKFFWCCFQPLSRRYHFFVRVVILKTNASPNCKDQYLAKKRSRTNKRTAIKKTCLFSGLSKELRLT